MNRLAYLDGVRGVAALIVILHHFGLAFYPAYYTANHYDSHFTGFQYDTYLSHSPLSVILNGNFAVCIFFVLSGIVLSNGFFRSKSVESLSGMAVRRYVRLIVPIFFSIVIAFILLRSNLMFNLEVFPLSKSLYWLNSLWLSPEKYHFGDVITVGLMRTVLFGDVRFNTVFWTMSIELMGSMLVFSLLFITQNLRKRFLCYLIAAAAFAFMHSYYYICFIGGIMISDVMVNKQWDLERLPKLFFAVLAVLGILLGSFPSGGDQGNFYGLFDLGADYETSIIYHSMGAILLVVGICYLPLVQRMLSSKPFRFLGYISFSSYLIHVLVLGSFSCWLFLKLFPLMSYHSVMAIVFSSSLLVICISSYLMTKFVDDKGIALSKYIYEKYFKKAG